MITSARRRHESDQLLMMQEKGSKHLVRNRLRGSKLTQMRQSKPEKRHSQEFDIVLIGQQGVKRIPSTHKFTNYFRSSNLEQQILKKNQELVHRMRARPQTGQGIAASRKQL